MGSVALQERTLRWEGCHNVRDLGGLQTAAYGRTRRGAVVRADNVRGLTAAGWQAALEHGVRRIVDLRFENEVPGEPEAHAAVEVISVSLHGRHDPVAALAFEEKLATAATSAPVFAAGYIHTLRESPDRVASALAAVAETDPAHGVVVHCFAGKDRTGIISALLLSLVGVPDEVVAADYAASQEGVEVLSSGWYAEASDEAELELRRRFSHAPYETMTTVLEWVSEQGGAEAYARQAGLTADQVAALSRRLSG